MQYDSGLSDADNVALWRSMQDPLTLAEAQSEALQAIYFAESVEMLRKGKTQEEIDFDEAMVELEAWLKEKK